jgi:hypothetical protein
MWCRLNFAESGTGERLLPEDSVLDATGRFHTVARRLIGLAAPLRREP